MNRDSVDWRGYWPAAPTPFSADGRIDDDALRALMEHYVRVGVHGVLVNGSSGEWWAQSAGERRHVAQVAVDAVAGRIPVVIGCTSFTAGAVTELAAHATQIGASGVLTTPPPYAHPTQPEILSFYEEIDKRLELPLIAYNWPRGAAVEIELDTARQISELDHVVAIKNSTASGQLIIDYIDVLAGKVRIFASLINRRGLAIMRSLGGDGYIDGGGVGAPHAVPFFDALWSGRTDAAAEHADRYWALTSGWINDDFSGRFGSPSSQLKAAMKILGQPGGEVRPPLLPTTDTAVLKLIADLLRRSGLLA